MRNHGKSPHRRTMPETNESANLLKMQRLFLNYFLLQFYLDMRNIFTADFFPAICFFCSYPGVVYKPQSNNKTEVMDHRSEGGKKEHQYV